MPISSASDYARRARQAARSGDYAQSGDFYRMAGDWKKANQMYLKGGHFDLAARLAEEMGDLPEASLYYLKAGDLRASAEIELRQGNRDKAARMFSRCGQHVRAAEQFEALEQYEAAAHQYERAGFGEKAAMFYVKADRPLIAAGLFEKLIAALEGQGPGAPLSESERASLLRYHRYCGELQQKGGEPQRAAPHFEAALMMEQAARAYREAGQIEKAVDILLRLQKPDEAYAILQEAGKDLSALAPAIQAEILARRGDHGEAAGVLEKAGSLYRAAEQWKAAGQLDRAARLFEQDGEFMQAADLYARCGNFTEAGRLYESGRDLKNAAEMYRRAGRHEDAARILLQGGDPIAAARILYDRKEYDACIKALQKVGPDSRDHRRASFLLGRIFAEQGLHTLAADKFQVAIGDEQVNNDTILMYYSLGLALEANLRPREALRVYQKILSFNYGYKDVLARMQAIESQPLSNLAARGTARHTGDESGWGEPDRYRVEGTIGSGVLGEVLRATDCSLGRKVAIRRIREQPHEVGKAERLLKEAASAARLSHSNIVSTYDTGADAEGKFIVSALAEGETLRSLLERRVRFEVNRVAAIGRQVLEALAHAHEKGVLHRNLRPENIYVTEEDRVTVGDFGLALRLSDFTDMELSGGRQIRYTPPEALRKDGVDARSDIYAFGIILYEMVAGHPPFTGSEIGHQQVHAPVPLPGPGERPIPEFLKNVILRCLEKDRADRYPDVATVLDDLQIKGVVPGMVVAGRYEVLAEVGRGGMGSVYRARDADLDETVALKFLGGEFDTGQVARFIQEIKSARSVNHPNVVRVFNFEKWGEQRFIVMEYIDGSSLARWIGRTPAPTRQDRVRLAVQIASAIDAAHHNGIIHRDIKPENILVTAAGDAKVLDFGIARAEAGASLTATGTVVGSPMYMSPEQIQSKPLDRRTDIYALGAVFYYLFTGVEPFQGKDVQEILMKHLNGRPRPPHEVDSSIPPAISAALLRALDPDPDRRFASAADLAAALSRTQRSAVA